MHLNIRSLTRNIENLSDYLLCLAHTFSIIGLSETWLNENSCLTQIPGYNFISQNRIGKITFVIENNLFTATIVLRLSMPDCRVRPFSPRSRGRKIEKSRGRGAKMSQGRTQGRTQGRPASQTRAVIAETRKKWLNLFHIFFAVLFASQLGSAA